MSRGKEFKSVGEAANSMEMKNIIQKETLANETEIWIAGSHNNSTFLPYYQHSPAVAAILIMAYLIVFLSCMAGNVLVCMVVVNNERMRTVTNFFILNLAISDLLVGIFCVPPTLMDNLITGWRFNQVICTMSSLVQGMSVSASVFTLVAIAMDRFHCIVLSFRERLSLVKAVVIIVVVWLLAIAIMCPSAIMLTVGRVEDHYMVLSDGKNTTYPLYVCYEACSDSSMRKVYTTILFVHIYLVPLMLILFIYGSICLKLCRSTAPITQNLTCPVKANGTPKKRIKVIKMLVLVALLFMISWLPLWTLMLLVDYNNLDDDHLDLLTGYFSPFAHWLAFSNSSINPIIYDYYNENFRWGFQAAFKFHLCSQEMVHQETYSEQSQGPTSFRMCNKVFAEATSYNSVSSRHTQNTGPLVSWSIQPKCPGLSLEDIDKIMTYRGINQAWGKTENC
ncbi:neuropeptide FF receptor 1-like isoform X2 [Podarcis raffonei]|uniref:neuropeptide FF receptor 1-like isoform X2 n=1 Tax=Podarcis raffonei TaxID=65483 RepID=UPI0023294772|nr:neuropeptide FF receptor 1-like isoform X2 [Podarcis raffonei]XP_053257507.1 neuropeptide FF receptor 1-like isoform X2 [Podarcis raffonei]XP_053257508.1 neuropeptide FF receptor 1-like isoform X2 [Podarcis raffonei]XP_053257509.1 neuropeptide FF receptor 1-like isoform X2 [Podarcis raffonei]XP_053257510.1 neuropeptide FF receptor 1-like isoform X2 [Podarcis raffonei]